VSPANHYRRLENRIFDFFSRKLRGFGNSIAESFDKFISFGQQRFTIMFIPHSEKKIFNFKISFFTLIFIGFLVAATVFSFFVFSTGFSGVSKMLSTKTDDLEVTQATLDEMRDEIDQLLKVSSLFEDSWKDAMNRLYPNAYQEPNIESGGDLASFINTEEQDAGTSREISGIQALRQNLDDSTGSLQAVVQKINTVEDLLDDLPIYWPVEGGVGHITNYFGPATNPFTNQMYLHKGLDIAFAKGRPIVAAANGKVIESGYDTMYGHFVVIKHLGGYFTK